MKNSNGSLNDPVPALKHYDPELRKRIYFLYEQHLSLFVHSDDFVQQRTTQFNTINTVFFAIYGVLLSSYFSVDVIYQDIKSLLVFISLFVAFLGAALSYVWLCSYKRSVLYRELHRDTLKVLDFHLQEAEKGTDYKNRVEFLGPFTVRDSVLYRGKCLQYGSGGKELKVGFLSRKKRFSNVESIPQFTIVVWSVFAGCSLFLLRSIGGL